MLTSPENCPAWWLTISVSPVVGGPQHLEFAADDDKERHRPVADFDEHLAARRLPTLTEGRNPRHVLRCERRKRAIKVRDGGGQLRQRGIVRVHRQPLPKNSRRSASMTASAHACGASCGRLCPMPPARIRFKCKVSTGTLVSIRVDEPKPIPTSALFPDY